MAMTDRSIVFLEIMIAIAVVGVLAFLIILVTRRSQRLQQANGNGSAPYIPQWYEFLLAILLVGVVAAFLIWQLSGGNLADITATNWRDDTRSIVFFVVMVVVGGIGLVGIFILFLVQNSAAQSRRAGDEREPLSAAAAATDAAPAQASVETPSAARLLGLLLLALAFLLLNWIYVPRGQQHALMANLFYPALLALTLVLLFDKAARNWTTKGKAETVREWLICDGMVFLLFLGFLNLRGVADAETYGSLFWDFLFAALLLVIFWLVDRKATRHRFLLAYIFFAIAPILLLIWRTVQGVEAPPELSWWSTIWPFFFLALLFGIFEIIALVTSDAADKHMVPALKDGLFFIIYGILLIVAIPSTG